MTPFRADGHLTDLALEHALAHAPLEGTDAHLAACGACRARLAAADAVELPAWTGMPNAVVEPPKVPAPANRPWIAVVGLLAAAVALLAALPLLRPAEGDGIRLRGDGLSLQVFRDGGVTSERLKDGDAVAPGDRLGFRVRNRDAGHLLVLGVDAADEAYVCYPQGEGGHSVEVGPSATPRTLPEAVRLDDRLGAERMFAVLCEQPFALEDVLPALVAGDRPEGCSVDGLALVKR